MKKSYGFVLLTLLLSLQFAAQGTYTFTGIYTGKPIFNIETRRGGVFLGNVVVELFPNIAMKHTRNFDSLVSKTFYDTTAFHRCIPGFMIQGGDPNSRSGPISTWGYGQPWQPTVPAEFSAAKHLRGILSAARSANPNSATSQFFICVAAYPSLNGQYSVYGQVVSGMNWVDTIALCPKMPVTYTNTPLQKVEMFITRIGSNDAVPSAPTLSLPANGSTDHDYLLPVSLNWSAVSDGIIYELQISQDSLFNTLTTPTIKTANLNYSVNGTLPSTTYFWRVRANNGGHFSAWSSVWKFRTLRDPEDPTGLRENTSNSAEITLFPNPNNGKFNMSGLNKGDKIQIFDALGKEVISVVSTDPTLNIALPSPVAGVYTYRISSVAGSREGRLIVR